MYRDPPATQPSGPEGALRVYVAGAVRDAIGVHSAPGAIATRNGRVVAAGSVQHVLDYAGPDARRIDLHDRLLVPGLVNAHTHLDLTRVGYRPFTGDFASWGKMIMAERRARGGDAGQAVRQGAELSLAAGVLTLGDIAGTPAATQALRQSKLRGVSFAEVGGLGASLIPNPSSDWLQPCVEGGIAAGIQPHAPYSTGPSMYASVAAIASRGQPVCTHLAELREELEFVATATGPMREFLVEICKWDDRYLEFYGKGKHPVEWFYEAVSGAKPRAAWLLAHCNYVEDSHIAMIAGLGASVAYCPRASEYFRHRNHRYRDMIAAGVNVCFGTDSIICHGSLSILDEMRRLYQRDRTDPGLLLRMATFNGMRGLGLDEKDATFAAGANPGVVAIRYDPRPGVDALEQVLSREAAPEIEVLETPAI